MIRQIYPVAGLFGFLKLCQEFWRRDAESGREGEQRSQARFAVAVLHRGDVLRTDAGPLGELRLGQRCLMAEGDQAPPEPLLDCGSHISAWPVGVSLEHHVYVMFEGTSC
jgi:hypothetical protein